MKEFTIKNGTVTADTMEDLKNRQFVLNEFVDHYNTCDTKIKKSVNFAERIAELSQVNSLIKCLKVA